MNIITQEMDNSILIDSESSQDEQRYALAHELAHYLIKNDQTMYSSEYCMMPMLFKEQEEMVADIFAVFLLIPLPTFIKEFSAYIGTQPVPIQTSEWLRYLGTVAKVPYEYVAIGYQNIRYVCCLVHDRLNPAENTENNNGIEISIRDEEIEQTCNKLLDNMRSVMTTEIVEQLFY